MNVHIEAADKPRLWRLKTSVLLGKLAPHRREEILAAVYGFHALVRGGALVIAPDGSLHMVLSLAMDDSMVEEVSQFVAGRLHRQIAHAAIVADLLKDAGLLEVVSQPHPRSGIRTRPDNFVSTLLAAGDPVVPSPTGRPASPEGMALNAYAQPGVPERVAELLGIPWRPTAGEPPDRIFTWEHSDDPISFLSYRIVEEASFGSFKHYPFKNDPYILLRLQNSDTAPIVRGTRLEAITDANNLLWEAWATGSTNVLGTFELMASPAGGWYAGGPWVAWPAASLLRSDSPVEAAATSLHHILLHAHDQNMAHEYHPVDVKAADSSDPQNLLSVLDRTEKSSPEFEELRNRILRHLAASPDSAYSRALRAALANKLW